MLIKEKYDFTSKERLIKISPFAMLLVISISIVFSHFVVMLYGLKAHHPHRLIELLVDSILLIVLISPLLYWFVLRPFINQINESTRVSRELTRSEDEFRNLVQTMNEGLVVQNNDGIITFANDRFCAMLAFNPAEIIGHSFADFMDQKNYHFLKDYLERIIYTEHNSVEITLEGKDLNKVAALVSPSRILNEDGKTEGIFLVVTDISSRKQMELELIDAKEKALVSNKLKSEFLAQMSHEIRTPINVIINVAETLKEAEGLDPKVDLHDELEALDFASRRIVRSIDLILNLSEIESGNYTYRSERVDIQNDLLIPLYKKFKDTATKKGLDFHITIQTKDLEIDADKFSVEQILANLIDNAIKFTENGEVAITVYRNNLNEICVEVLDTGIGISKEYQSKMFELFTQEDHGYSRKYEGNGLGLALVKKYCELNDVKISFESHKGKGTVFTVAFNPPDAWQVLNSLPLREV